ncbi:extracellular calcium-sensing receptor-like [Sphaeramia orbicularis]|uniref:extracellular calcium-sensing receptor-like n=1 Tax=Sphaeramia orbicularis TaxID=375764 RepID=UPI0011805AA6|nr:extracellular calcium-sensing receptor-like [Sphaeramia orbicularis]
MVLLILPTVLSRQIGLEGVQATVCSRWETHTKKGLFQDGDAIIGGLFNLYYKPSFAEQDFTKKPHYQSCSGFGFLELQFMYSVAFAVEEINRNSSLLQGVKLGYRILDSCGRYPWALQSALSLIGGDEHSCNLTVSTPQSVTNGQTGDTAAAHALHSLLSCSNRDSPTNNSSTCSSAKHITPRELLQHFNKVNISPPHGERFYFQGADIPPKYDLVNWQKTPEGSLKLVVIGYVDEFDLQLNETVIQWNTGSNNEVPVSVCSQSCPPGTRKANRKGEPVCCFDCIPCGEGEISNITGSLHCQRCPSEFWSNTEQTVCIRHETDFLSFNETLGITLTTVAVSGVIVTTAVFVVFLYYRQTPMMSYTASCPCLSDRQKFPNFFRTIPSDVYQAQAMARLVLHFKWTWIGAVILNDDYGHSALQVFQREIQGKQVCLDFIKTISWETSMDDIKKAAVTIQASTARVILIFYSSSGALQLFLQLAQRNVTGRLFIASEAWSTSDVPQNVALSKLFSGVVGVAIRSSTIPGFENYIRKLNPYDRPEDVWIKEYWEKEFGCSPRFKQSHKTPLSLQKSSLPPCSGTETLEEVQSPLTDMSQLRVTYNIYLAVYAAAHALHSLLSCPNRDSPTNNSSTCSSAKHIKPRELLKHMNKVNISTPHGEMFSFRGADIPAKYDLVNWQKTTDGQLRLVLIGHVDEFDVHLNESAIQWNIGSNEVPVSVCSKSCPPGTRKATRKGEPVCCFDCIPCGEGEISNITGSPHCERCPSEFWSNVDRTVCVPRQIDFLSFNESLGITLTTAAVSGVIVTTAVFVVFLYYRQTPMVRANNSELSFLLLLSLKLCFLCSLVFIGRPSVWSCRFQQAAFGISFVLCVSCLLVKTMVVLAAFRSARPGAAALMKWFGPGLQRGSVCLFTSVQIIICIIWLSLSPPVPHRNLGIQGSKVTLECTMASVVAFSLVLGYIGLLACTCLFSAFLARKLPDNFNEAKLITFSMLIFCAVWVAFVPAYVSSPGKYVAAVEVFAILASSYGLLFCIFAPKCFIILLRPEKNTKKHMMAR